MMTETQVKEIWGEDPPIYCPHCNICNDGVTHFRGYLYNPCDNGCCTTLACTRCKCLFKLTDLGNAWENDHFPDWSKLRGHNFFSMWMLKLPGSVYRFLHEIFNLEWRIRKACRRKQQPS